MGALSPDEAAAFVTRWRVTLYEAGYLAPGWPMEYGGGGLSRARAGDPGRGVRQGRRADGRAERRLRHHDARQHAAGVGHRGAEAALPAADPVRRGHVVPGLLGAERRVRPRHLASRPQLDGDQWVLNGQKIWTSAGHLADHIFTLARTDPDAPKHKGISFLLVDMRQPGIEVRPIKMISGESEFNEVFYTDAVCPKHEVVGGVNNGWAVAMSLLGYERGAAAATTPIHYPGRARPAAPARQGARCRRRPAHPPAAGVVLLEGRDHALPRDARAHPVPRRSSAGSRRARSRSCTGASTTGSRPSWRSTSSAPTR